MTHRTGLRIMHLANFYGPRSGGLRTTMHALGAGYRAAGHEMVMVVPGAVDADEQTPAGRRITLAAPVVPRTGGYRVITDVDRVRTLLTDLAPDRLEVSDRSTLRGLGAAARRLGIPSVFFAHERLDGVLAGILPRGTRALAPMLADLHNRATGAGFDKVVCTTHFAAAEFDRIGRRTEHVPLGVELDLFRPERFDADVRARHADHDELLVVVASRLSVEKRVDLALDAVAELATRGVPVRLVVAGAGPQAGRLRRRADACPRRGQDRAPVRFTGFVQSRAELADLLAAADVVLAPGPIETFGLAALEALASGTPVVCHRASALPEIVGPAGAVGWQRTVDTMLTLHGAHAVVGACPGVVHG